MNQTLGNRAPVEGADAAKDLYIKAFRGMLLARLLDEKFAAMYRAGKFTAEYF